MALTPSAMVALGRQAPEFSLPDTQGRTVSRQDFEGRPLLVAFICNHCPYVKHIADRLADVGELVMEMGIAMVAISSNDAQAYPEDGPDAMAKEKEARGFPFSYLFDESQDVARAFDARCTPDFFLYDDGHRLVYRGQFDNSRPGNGVPVTGGDILAACRALKEGGTMPEQVPSMGCNIKWK